MKRLMTFCGALGLFVASAHAADTTVEFPLTGHYYKKNREFRIDVPKLNRTLNKQNLDGLPELVVVSESAAPYGKLLLKRIAEANKVLPEKQLFVIDQGYLHEYPKMCYRGEISNVPTIIQAMLGTFLTDEQNILAMRWKKKTLIHSDVFKSPTQLKDTYGDESDEVRAWLDFDSDSDTVLIMSDLGPQGDGTELYETAIQPCKEN
ncbi:hypothetical protein K2X30_15575 [bacterium]|nr:hypothetical protein [bacterium]